MTRRAGLSRSRPVRGSEFHAGDQCLKAWLYHAGVDSGGSSFCHLSFDVQSCQISGEIQSRHLIPQWSASGRFVVDDMFQAPLPDAASVPFQRVLGLIR